jgi:hypothetical protein
LQVKDTHDRVRNLEMKVSHRKEGSEPAFERA